MTQRNMVKQIRASEMPRPMVQATKSREGNAEFIAIKGILVRIIKGSK